MYDIRSNMISYDHILYDISGQVELEEDLEKAPEAPAEQRYARDAEEAVPWPVQGLARQVPLEISL